MMSKKDQQHLKTMENKWNNFLTCRKKKEFELSDDHPSWLSMMQREDMLNTIFKILDKYKTTQQVTVYGID